MKKFSFRAFRNPSEADREEDQATAVQKTSFKRREQVRRAQRNHRERKDAYVKSLENEVLQLRTNEAKFLQDIKALQAEVTRLQMVLTENKIPHGSNIDAHITPLSEESYDLSFAKSVVILSQKKDRGPQIQVRKRRPDLSFEDRGPLLSDPAASGSPSQWTGSAQSPALSVDIPTSSLGLSPPEPPIPTPLTGTPSPITDLDLTNVGMEFVLTLENPCLPHIPGNPKEPEAPTGHALTATASLLFQAPDGHRAHLPAPRAWDTPRAGLERLLELSENIALEEEVTPVQAWNYIRQHPAFRGINFDLLRKLTVELLQHVKCYGFGAVIEQTVFENAVFDMLCANRS